MLLLWKKILPFSDSPSPSEGYTWSTRYNLTATANTGATLPSSCLPACWVPGWSSWCRGVLGCCPLTGSSGCSWGSRWWRNWCSRRRGVWSQRRCILVCGHRWVLACRAGPWNEMFCYLCGWKMHSSVWLIIFIWFMIKF